MKKFRRKKHKSKFYSKLQAGSIRAKDVTKVGTVARGVRTSTYGVTNHSSLCEVVGTDTHTDYIVVAVIAHRLPDEDPGPYSVEARSFVPATFEEIEQATERWQIIGSLVHNTEMRPAWEKVRDERSR